MQKMNEVQKKSVRRHGPFLTQIMLFYNDNFTTKQSCKAEFVLSLIFLPITFLINLLTALKGSQFYFYLLRLAATIIT